MIETKLCILCGRELECVFDTWEDFQPYGGGEVRFIFAYGSDDFDLAIGNTVFQGVVCDACAATCINRMTRKTND